MADEATTTSIDARAVNLASYSAFNVLNSASKETVENFGTYYYVGAIGAKKNPRKLPSVNGMKRVLSAH